MRIALEGSGPLRGDMVLRATLRSDLTPIPATLELSVRTDSTASERIAERARILVGDREERYVVIKAATSRPASPQRDTQPVKVRECVAVPEVFEALAWPQPRATVKVGKSMSEAFQACGAKLRFTDDIPAPRFACFCGDFATQRIAQVLQEEGAVLTYSAAGLARVLRYRALFEQDPAAVLGDDAATAIESSLVERHEVPWAFSTDASGAPVFADREVRRAAVYLPRTSERVLRNMGRCLVTRRKAAIGWTPAIRAGDRVDVGRTPHVVVTAAHDWQNGGDAAASQTTSLWLATMSD